MSFDARLFHGFMALVAGGTGSGKTTWVFNLLRNRHSMIFPNIDRVYYFYAEDQPIYKQMKDEQCVDKFIADIPSAEAIKHLTRTKGQNVLIIIDDNMKNVNADFSEIFTTFRHRNASVIFMTQNMFHQNKEYRTMSLNANYITIMKNPRDQSQIINFAKQFSPYNTRFIADVFRYATYNRPFSYLFFDLRQETSDSLRVKTNIFPHEWPMSVFLKSNTI